MVDPHPEESNGTSPFSCLGAGQVRRRKHRFLTLAT